MASPTAIPYLIIQSDWNEVLKKEGAKSWISCKMMGSPALHGTLEMSGQKDCPLRTTISPGFAISPACGESELNFRSIEISHSDPNCQCRFVAPERTFRSIHLKSVDTMDVTRGQLGISASSSDGKLNIWETSTGIIRRSLVGHKGDVYKCRFFPSGQVALSAGADMQLKLWLATTGQCIATMIGHVSAIQDVAFVDRGRNILSVAKDGTARLWDCSTSSCLDVIAKTNCEINACDIAQADASSTYNNIKSKPPIMTNEVGTEGKLLLMACEDRTLRVVDIRSRTEIFSKSCSAPVTSCRFVSPTKVACGLQDGLTLKMDLRSSSIQVLDYWLDSAASVLSLSTISESESIIVGKADGLCFVYGGSASEKRVQLTGSDCDPINGIAVDGTYIFTGSRDGAIRKYPISILEQ